MASKNPQPYKPSHPVRIVTAAALFDGHDASINVMRRILQASGAEVIHLGHNRSVEEVVDAAIQEDAQGIAVSSYQGGHMEYFRYLRRRLDERGASHIRIFGGGGGVIVPSEIEALQRDGIDRIFSPEDGRRLGLQGMINEVLTACDFDPSALPLDRDGDFSRVAGLITRAELNGDRPGTTSQVKDSKQTRHPAPVVGLTGTGGAGKSSLTDELVRRFQNDFSDKKVAVLSVDPTRRKTGGALLGDRIRFNSLRNGTVFMRSLATRGSSRGLSESIRSVLDVVEKQHFDLVFLETAGIGQGDNAISEVSDLSVYVMTAEYGAPSQLEKIEMLDYADFVAINKFNQRGSLDALRDVRKQFQRNHGLFDADPETLPVFGTSAAHFNDSGVNALYAHIIARLNDKFHLDWKSRCAPDQNRLSDAGDSVIPPKRERYLSEISEACRSYRQWAEEEAEQARDLEGLARSIRCLGGPLRGPQPFSGAEVEQASQSLRELMTAFNGRLEKMAPHSLGILRGWDEWAANYRGDRYTYLVRGRQVTVDNYHTTLSETRVPKVSLPRYRGWGERLHWRLVEGAAGEFPYAAGVFPFKRVAEMPTRMFAGEGPAERTNRRFHLLADGQPAKRLSTAFDSITLYGEEPDRRPDIYGKIGESGVSIFSVEEAERLYAGFDLCDPATSVSMTINGPAPTILAFFFNTAIRQRCRRFLREEGRLEIGQEEVLQPDSERGSSWDEVRRLLSDAEYESVKERTLATVRGTVQADILKEDQGQNTCIFSTEFSLRVLGDVQQYFIDHNIRNFYSVSISGYHIAEAGANPIHQLAYTLANGFTYVEYYLSRGMRIDDFAPNLSFFFSNGMDAEYSVIGRVARRIWAVAMRERYGAGERSQKLKYHIQTSGRSLHAQEIDFNDIRTTLQALLAVYDNAQSLHTNAYDEAITTPTQESVRRAMAIQLIINREFGLAECENPTQGSFIIEELTDLVEEAVLAEFDRLTERGGVLGAMERQYQRGQIQDDSLKYERLKHSGKLPIIGVNTFLRPDAEEVSAAEPDLTRAAPEEKEEALRRLKDFQERHRDRSQEALARVREAALEGRNVFEQLMSAARVCSLGQITRALYQVGGQYRRNM